MSVLLMRKLLNGLVILSLALPAGGMRVCCCARGATIARQTAAAPSPSLPPCCAKRLAAQTANESVPALKSKCCCGDVRWSQLHARVMPARADDAWSGSASGAVMTPAANLASFASPSVLAERGLLRAVPPDSSCIALCRWQV